MTVTGADGFSYRSATAGWADGASLTLDEPLDAAGAPFQLLPPHRRRARLQPRGRPQRALRALAGAAPSRPDGAFIFFGYLKVHPGALNYEVGAGVATRSRPARRSRRACPTCCSRRPCRASRSAPSWPTASSPLRLRSLRHVRQRLPRRPRPPGDPTTSAAWTVWDSATWNADLTQGTPVLHGAPGDLSVSWNAHLAAYLAVHSADLLRRRGLSHGASSRGPVVGRGAALRGRASHRHDQLRGQGAPGEPHDHWQARSSSPMLTRSAAFDEDVRVATPTRCPDRATARC